jgi:hypothetical protein
MPRPLPLPLRALNAAAAFAMKHRWLSPATAVLDVPHDERLKRKAMTIARKPGDSDNVQRGLAARTGYVAFARLATHPAPRRAGAMS